MLKAWGVGVNVSCTTGLTVVAACTGEDVDGNKALAEDYLKVCLGTMPEGREEL